MSRSPSHMVVHGQAVHIGPTIVVVRSERELQRADKAFRLNGLEWMGQGMVGRTCTMEGSKGGLLIVVQLSMATTDQDLLATIVHESVHVWQSHCSFIGEEDPSKEFSAYAVQAIFGQIMTKVFDKKMKRRSVR